jgi:hypothetical protein
MASSFPLVRGRTMRVTKTDGCCAPAYGPDNMVVTDGFVSVALTANINTPDEIVITNANGKTCVRDAGCPEFQGYGVEITFCEVSPCLFSIVTGQPTVLDAQGEVVGFRMNSGISVCDSGFALEVWMGVPGVACSGDAGGFGYLLLPCLQGGVIGDFTIENAAITFTVTGANTKAGNGWGYGPYQVVEDVNGDPGYLPQMLDPDDHLYVSFTAVPPPDETDGCVELEAPPIVPATGATAGTPGMWTPPASTPPANAAAATSAAVVASPTTAWTVGQYVQGSTAGAPGQMHWDGTAWAAGAAPVLLAADAAASGGAGKAPRVAE